MGQKIDFVPGPNSPGRTTVFKQLRTGSGTAPAQRDWNGSGRASQNPESAARRDQISPSSAPRAGSRNILLVSDDEGQRSLLRAYLQHVGFKVFSYADMESAARLVAAGQRVDLLLVDSHLLTAEPCALNQPLAEHCPNLLVFAISGKRTTDGTLLEVKHRVCGQDSQSFQLPDLLGRIQALADNTPGAERPDTEPLFSESGKILSFPAR
jgi:hypothetical protein